MNGIISDVGSDAISRQIISVVVLNAEDRKLRSKYSRIKTDLQLVATSIRSGIEQNYRKTFKSYPLYLVLANYQWS